MLCAVISGGDPVLPSASDATPTVERSNGAASVDDLTPTKTLGPHAERREARRAARITGINPQAAPIELDESPPQVDASILPSDSDGLIGNRYIALAPFPNLNMQSGPLAQYQLPWYHRVPDNSPYTFWKATEYTQQASIMTSNGREDTSYGWYNSLLSGVPFWVERGVGLEIGFITEPTTFPQVYVGGTGGFFKRAIWTQESDLIPAFVDRLSLGVVYDGLFDSEHRAYLGQARIQGAFALSPNREVGLWSGLALQRDFAREGSAVPINLAPSNYVTFYYRQTMAVELDVTLFAGFGESPGGMQTGGYLEYRFTKRLALLFSGFFDFNNLGPNALFLGFKFFFQPLENYSQISGNPQNRYRPFMRVIDHINFQIRKRPATEAQLEALRALPP